MTSGGKKRCSITISVFAIWFLEICRPRLSEAWSLAQTPSRQSFSKLLLKNENWDDDVNYDKEFPADASSASSDPTLGWNTPKMRNEEAKLGIDIGSMLEPLSREEAADLKAAATEIINDAIAEGIDEIERVRAKMKTEFEKNRRAMELASELNAKRESERLMNKIDKLTGDFLSKTETTRVSTKLAAAADRAMEGKGLEMGTWGVLGGATVMATGAGSLIGSVNAAQNRAAGTDTQKQTESRGQEKKIIVIADKEKDQHAKLLLPLVTSKLEDALPGLEVKVYQPTATLPLGGENAACVLLFCTSLTDKSTVSNGLDRLLRRTIQSNGALGQPPSQLVAVTTIGTERTNKMPFSMQNMMGGKLDKRRQMEEAVITTVRQRVTEPALDYTICKFGELKSAATTTFQFGPGDAFEGTTDVETAATILMQAIALQPFARNATLSCVGSLQDDASQERIDDCFLRLDGPEVFRTDLDNDVDDNYEQLVEYTREWAKLLTDSGKGLTTPIRAEISESSRLPPGVKLQAGVKLLFLPTATGKYYSSRDEEKAREKEGSSSTSVRRKTAMEGGVEVLVEVTDASRLRIRAKRCNYADDTVVKELSEETILSRLKESIAVWKKDHAK